MKLKVGDPAPPFTAATGNGNTSSLSDFAGKKLVLYFYPKDDTRYCTRQACSLRDAYHDIRTLGAEVLGVSTQDEASHQRFSRKHELVYPLLADTDRSIATAYGTIGGYGLQSLLMGFLGLTRRVTFIIDEDGRIGHIIDRPDAGNHAAEVLALLREGSGRRALISSRTSL